jgi:type I restriction enzyme S subunit
VGQDFVEGFKMTELGPVPEDWEVVRLGEVAAIGHKRGEHQVKSLVAFIPMALLPEEDLYIHTWELRPAEQVRSGVLVHNGDLLLARITPCLENGKQGVVRGLPDGWGYATTEVLPIYPKGDQLYLGFLGFYLREPRVRQKLAAKMEGTTGRQRLTKPVLINLRIPLPTLPEQQAIADILRSVDRRIEAEENRKAALEALFKTLLHHLMTAKTRLPSGFVVHFQNQRETDHDPL